MPAQETNPERWRRLEAIFHQVTDAPVAEKNARLQALCGEDSGLLQDATSLLQAADDEERFTASYVQPDLPDVPDTHIGRRIGPYCLERLLGRGGMAAVTWHAGWTGNSINRSP